MHRAGCGDNNIPVVGTPRQQLRRRTEPHPTSVMESPRSSTRALAPSCCAVAWLAWSTQVRTKKRWENTNLNSKSKIQGKQQYTVVFRTTLRDSESWQPSSWGCARDLAVCKCGGPTSVALFFSMKTQYQRNGKERVDRRERKRRRCKKPCSAHLATVSKIQESTKEQRTDRSNEPSERSFGGQRIARPIFSC